MSDLIITVCRRVCACGRARRRATQECQKKKENGGRNHGWAEAISRIECLDTSISRYLIVSKHESDIGSHQISAQAYSLDPDVCSYSGNMQQRDPRKADVWVFSLSAAFVFPRRFFSLEKRLSLF